MIRKRNILERKIPGLEMGSEQGISKPRAAWRACSGLLGRRGEGQEP